MKTLAHALSFALLVASCASVEQAAKKDPMKCERDPKCAQKSRAADCSTQCADDPACVDRCREVNETTGASGR